MLGRILSGIALWIGVYVLLTGVHFGTLWGLDQLRTALETRYEEQYGSEVVDREPPYTTSEWIIVSLDVQPSMYWGEALAMSALMSLPVALLIQVVVWTGRRRLMLKTIVIGSTISMLVFYLLYLLNEQVFAGYLIQAKSPIFVIGALTGILQGFVGGSIYGASRRRSGGGE